jgi:hypothetical protein
MNMAEGTKEKVFVITEARHGLVVAAARRLARAARSSLIGARADNKLSCSAAVVERKCREGQQYRQ